MHNYVLSPISTDNLIEQISERAAEKTLKKILEYPNLNFLSSQKTEQVQTLKKSTQFFNVDELAQFLFLKKSTVYSNYSKGLIPGGCKQGKRVLFDKQIILEWVRSSRKLSNAEIDAEAETYLATKRRGGHKNA